MDIETHGEAEETEDLPHPFAVAGGEVIVDGDHMNAFAGNGVEIGRQRGHQCFPFPGFHFGDAAVVENHAADELDIKVAHTQHPFGCFPHHGEGFGEEFVEGFAVGVTLFEFRGFPGQLFIAVSGDRGFEAVDDLHLLRILFDVFRVVVK